MDSNFAVSPKNEIGNKTYNLVFSTYLNTKFNVRHANKTGVVVTNLQYDLLLKNAEPRGAPLQQMVNEKGNSNLLNAYSNSTLHFGATMTANVGVNAQFFTLNNAYSIEPRVGLKYRFRPDQTFSAAYGLHSRLERLSYYFITDILGRHVNRDIGVTKAHHFVIGYDVSPSEMTHLKIEAYYQHLFHVPVVANTSFSIINQLNDWFFDGNLESNGQGRNYGLDLSYEKYLSKGFYYMTTASVFRSKYKGGDHQWRNTRYNRNFALNLLMGKEWQTGKSKKNIFGLNARFSLQGSDRFSPVNNSQSLIHQDPVFHEENAFSQKFPPAFINHLTANYKWNMPVTTHEIALKVINTTMYQEFQGFRYNFQTGTVDQKREAVFFPNLSYKFEF